MPEILQDWLGTRLGVILDMSPQKFGRNTKDGTLLSRLLYIYGVVPLHVHERVKESKNYHVCYSNLIVLKPWLNHIGVTQDDTTLQSMARGEGSAAISVFYAVYLNLEKKDRFHYISAQKERRFSEVSCKKFKVDWVPEKELTEKFFEGSSKLEVPLLEKSDMINWHKVKCKEIVDRIKNTKVKYEKSVIRKHKKDLGPVVSRHVTSQLLNKRLIEAEETREKIITFEKKHPYKNLDLNFSELIELKNAVEDHPSLPVLDYSKARKILGNIKRRKKTEVYAKNFQLKMEHIVLDEYWKHITEEQDSEFENTVCANLLKQSQYEKQMATKLHVIRNKKKVLAENRRKIECLKMYQGEKDYDDLTKDKMEMKGEYWEDEEFEKERLKELHRRLYDAKAKWRKDLLKLESRKLCEALVDIAIRISEIRNLTLCQVPKSFIKDMKELFYKDLSIFDLIDNFEELHEGDRYLGDEGEGLEEEEEGVFYRNTDYEKLKNEEMKRQKLLNECDFNDYINLLGPWMVQLFFPDDSEGEIKHAVLGYIVHKLLMVKYPPPKSVVPADVKRLKPVVVVLGLTDEIAYKMFIDLMESCKILVVRVDDAINFVLLAYKEELSVVRDIDINFQKVTLDILKGKTSNEKEKDAKKKIQLLKKESPENMLPEDGEYIFIDKETQTPRMIPEEDPLLSPNAEIGKLAFEALGSGDPVADLVIISAVIAYVRSKQDEYSGWVLLNYPFIYPQASDLEYNLTGYRNLPILEDVATLEEREGFAYRGPWSDPFPRDDFAENRVSRLVPKQDSLLPPVDFPKTYFDLFIKVNKSSDSQRKCSQDYQEPSPLEEFYSRQEIFINFEYQVLNFQTIKDLGKMILEGQTRGKDSSLNIAPKNSLEIFGSTVFELNEKWNPTLKKKNGKEKDTPSKRVAVTETGKLLTESIGENTFEETEEKKDIEESMATERSAPKPGDPDWDWASGPQQESIQVALATIWENMEAVYVEDFKDVFFCLRVHRSNVYSYSDSIKKSMSTLMRRSDEKQKVLGDFQQMFNEIDEDLRPDVDIKCELHVRVSELEQALMSIADQRKADSQRDLKKICEDGWVADEMASLVNAFLTALQLESDRCIDSCQVIMDYYLTLQQKIPDEKPLEKVVVPKLQVRDRKYSIVSSGSNKLSSGLFTPRTSDPKRSTKSLLDASSKTAKTRSWIDKRRRTTDSGFLEGAAEVITDMLANLTLPEGGVTPFHNFFVENVQLITNEVKNTLEGCIFETKKCDKGLPKNQKKGSDTKIMNTSGNLNIEWTTALENELSRFLFRTKLILARGIFDMNEFLTTILNVISALAEDITEMYLKEINSISECCKVFRCGIEEEIQIRPQLELKEDEFVVNDDVLLSHSREEPVDEVEDEQKKSRFTIEQLSLLCSKFQRVAPSGEIIRQSMMYILEDLRVLKPEVENMMLFPEVWRQIPPVDLNMIMNTLYQNLEIVHWKDFIIYAMDLPVPTQAEILWMRTSFRKFDPHVTELIARDNFETISFWFEVTLDHYRTADRNEKAKDLLYRMYQVDERQTNYSALLLAFCKDEDPIQGFVKALALAMGQNITLKEVPDEIVSLPGENESVQYDISEEEEKSSLKKAHCCPTNFSQVSMKCIPKERIVRCQCQDFEKSVSTEVTTDEDYEEMNYAEDVGEDRSLFYYGSEVRGPPSASVVPSTILSSLLKASFPSLPQLSILLDCKQTFQETLNSIYDSLDSNNTSVEVSKLIKHKFIDRLLHNTNKFKFITMKQTLQLIANYKNSMGRALCLPDKLNVNICLN